MLFRGCSVFRVISRHQGQEKTCLSLSFMAVRGVLATGVNQSLLFWRKFSTVFFVCSSHGHDADVPSGAAILVEIGLWAGGFTQSKRRGGLKFSRFRDHDTALFMVRSEFRCVWRPMAAGRWCAGLRRRRPGIFDARRITVLVVRRVVAPAPGHCLSHSSWTVPLT